MSNMLSYVLVALVFAASLVSEVAPLPTGAISCPQGVAAVEGPHIACEFVACCLLIFNFVLAQEDYMTKLIWYIHFFVVLLSSS